MKKMFSILVLFTVAMVSFSQRTATIDTLVNADTVMTEAIVNPELIQVSLESVSGTATGVIDVMASLDNINYQVVGTQSNMIGIPSDTLSIEDGAMFSFKAAYFPYWKIRARASSGTQETAITVKWIK